jgi:hypothetical protein
VRRLVCIFLLLILPLHALALQGGWSPGGNAFDLAHEMAHHHGDSHHHDEDGSIHYDDSLESAKHLTDSDFCQQTAAMPPPALPLLNLPSSAKNPPHPSAAVPQRFPECPQRPPSARP